MRCRVEGVSSECLAHRVLRRPCPRAPSHPQTSPLPGVRRYYFVCGQPGHCSAGQKVKVVVTMVSPPPPSASPPPEHPPAPPMSPDSGADSGDPDSVPGLAIGLALGGCLLVAVLGAVACIWYRKRRMQTPTEAPPPGNRSKCGGDSGAA